jgi:hypothetical protein
MASRPPGGAGKSAITSVNSGFRGQPAGCDIELSFAAMFPLFAER